MCQIFSFLPCSLYDSYGFCRASSEDDLDANPLVARAIQLDHQARSVENALDVRQHVISICMHVVSM